MKDNLSNIRVTQDNFFNLNPIYALKIDTLLDVVNETRDLSQ